MLSKLPEIIIVSFAAIDNKQAENCSGCSRKKGAAKQPGYDYLKLPANGGLLKADYQGSFKDLPLLYNAMDKYVRDKGLKKVAQPNKVVGLLIL